MLRLSWLEAFPNGVRRHAKPEGKAQNGGRDGEISTADKRMNADVFTRLAKR